MKTHILISSHSKANDIWYITNYFLMKYWKGDVEIYLGANGEDRKEFVPNSWRYINNGEDVSFSKSLMSYLRAIDEEYFILMLDDFIILEEVNTKKIEKAFDFIKSNNGVYLRLVPNPKGEKRVDNDFSKIDVESKVPYVTSLQMAIWKKDFLMQLLSYDFSPWEFELKAGKTKESMENRDKFFVTNYNFIKYTHFVEKGKFYPYLKDILKKEGLILNSTREFLSEEELKNMQDSCLKKSIRNLLPSRYINFIRKLIGKEPL
ncbi:hypothetical protein KFV02_03735 [Desulfohalobiaceae bacterium Ax17]|uniref:hypothetical protein n=1 Tax=Desulfovulcanus ferrireducens TaxID=2831190 RepID=UPI00207BC13C|nr:hypothetical protein [Desulfovulcanus ferrireducens]MBT8763038.1 hypothetical protein [Desulfovulcanus ferrireducens]